MSIHKNLHAAHGATLFHHINLVYGIIDACVKNGDGTNAYRVVEVTDGFRISVYEFNGNGDFLGYL